ncbi:hypothetical protein N9527_01625 [Pseudomonadales bacterium]|nr:hypothetical protein [Pseudomonadales bacterium]
MRNTLKKVNMEFSQFERVIDVATMLLHSDDEETRVLGEFLLDGFSPLPAVWVQKYAELNGGTMTQEKIH